MKAPITLIAAAALGLAGGGAGCTRTDESPEVATIEAEFPSRPTFRHLSSVNGDLPVPGESHQQTASLVADLDGDGVDDFVLGFRRVAPALVWYRRTTDGWDRVVIEDELLTVEAGGAAHDIDGDGDLDLVFGGDWQSTDVWWWENPAPAFDPEVSWTRRVIKTGGQTQHHDQAFGDFLGTGTAQLAFWNQGAGGIFLAEKPDDPRGAETWNVRQIYAGEAGEDEGRIAYPEGLSVADIDGDGADDLLAGNIWLRHEGDGAFQATRLAEVGGLIFAGRFKPGTVPQVVIAAGDGTGPLRWSESTGDPADPASWVAHDLLGWELVHGHTLQVGDIDADGNLDIFAAEMGKWSEKKAEPDNPEATAYIFYGDGTGGFETTVLVKGHGFHEGRLADLDGDGDLDILNKPYNWKVPRVDVWLNEGPGE
ncbi:MAG: FG-GAP-like repeat-containing protein [Acidobacteria bacterium]|nr:FG-GAP-like repeat-containing protein [Acidobacteriota bacterium]